MIRVFQHSDMEAVLNIEEQAFPKTAYDKRTFQEFAASSPDTFLLYIDSGETAAYIMYWPNGHIVSVAVQPRHRRKGIGTRLVERAVQSCHGFARIEVRKSNAGAQSFYRKLGFLEVGTVPDYYGDEDAVVMVRVDRP